MKSKPFIDEMLYVVDGELMNHMIKLLTAMGKADKGLPVSSPNKEKVLNYMIKSIIQCSNYPTGEVNDQIDDIDFEDMLWKLGIKLPNEDDPDNQYPEEDQ